ncbi:hypothetical protein [Pedobacter sp. MC2016-24]|uniref:hypothetical protein n=1 Tax=Pedobacter sp. MC2016-24 TaxID=2780090 RepID=UPI00187E6D09|nr:hypothetical protein [Pedobacter sp. MC2016-24]MBE9599873.1 hypothetical protein [Pedobacter sp. MC2016-24]
MKTENQFEAANIRMEDQELTVLSFGAGQDSTYILYKIIRDPFYRARFVTGDFIVVMSDTGDEHDHTYEHVCFIAKLCSEYEIEFHFLTADQGYHPNTWQTLTSQMIRNSSIMSMMMPRSCTDNVKIKPFYNFLNVYIANKYYNQELPNSTRNKTWIKRFAADYGKINVILGIAAGEEKRVKESKTELKKRQLDLFVKVKRKNHIVWMMNCILKTYPMIAEGIDRKMAQDYILATPWPLPPPSNCKRCPFLSKQEILWMYRFIPAEFYEWVAMEQAKIDKCSGLVRNLGVKGEKLLPEILAEAIAEYGHWTNDQLHEYKMSHGHCVLSKF